MQIGNIQIEIKKKEQKQTAAQERTEEEKENLLNVSIELLRIKTDDKTLFLKDAKNKTKFEKFMLIKTFLNKVNYTTEEDFLDFMIDLLRNYKGKYTVSERAIRTTEKYNLDFNTLCKKYLE